MRCVKVLKLYTPVGLTSNLIPGRPTISQFTPDRDEDLRVGEVVFTAMEADFNIMQRLGRPQLTQAGAGYPYTVTVTQSAASAIYYTVDGSHPWPNNPTASLYSGPVTVNQACLFRARAFGSGDSQLASDTAALNFT